MIGWPKRGGTASGGGGGGGGGDPQPPSQTEEIVGIAGVALPALKCLYEGPDGRVYPLSNTDSLNIDAFIGISKTSGNSGDAVKIKRGGILDVTGLGLLRGRVFCGHNGALTSTPPTTGYDLLVGYVMSGGRMSVAFEAPIKL